MKSLIFVKLGGSLITDKHTPYTPKLPTIKNLVGQIKEVERTHPDLQIILGNGAGSFGHYAATELHVAKGLTDESQKFGFAFVQAKVKELNSILVEDLLRQKINAVSIHPSSIMTAVGGKIRTVSVDALSGIVALGMIPVIYGDIVYDTKEGSHIFSTEDQFEILIPELMKRHFSIKKIIYLSIVDGVMDDKKKVIAEITQKTYPQIQQFLYKTEGFDVTGGMRHKIERSLTIAAQGIQTVIVNGQKKNSLLDAIGGAQIGTLIS